eukprot:TRINITY_DN75814_c0_g1_i1.p1 TRINITY_DN75814_c0_g1~~TRINITY_DN75814_c0_g1_i1.p1  ORF type:complete len:454 (+),score=89.85 TRINITY_DN75814_c0_g1_i1:63-1364(+)
MAATEGLAQSSSSPTLPPVSGASPPVRLPPGAMAAQARAAKNAAGEAGKRKEFLAGFINEDLSKLTSWHGTRPAHEQKRFLRSVDALYKAFDSASGGGEQVPKAPKPTEAERAAAIQAAQEAAVASAAAMQRAAEEDPLNGPPRSPRALAPSASEPCMVPEKPIEVFEQRKRAARKQRDPTAENPNSLLEWLDGQSVTTQTTASTATTRRTRFSDLTMTSLGGSSICSEPGTMHQMQFRNHKRAYAANKNNWTAMNQHEAGFLKDGVPNISWPDSERYQTSFKDQFGSPQLGRHVTKKMYEHILKPEQHEFVNRFLETAQPEQREQFTGMVRSLECLRRSDARAKTSMNTQDYDLQENARLWRPPKQQPVFETSEVNLSRVPLGSMQQTTKKVRPPASPQTNQMPPAPPSPSVSGLGSLPLTRLSTPLVVSSP